MPQVAVNLPGGTFFSSKELILNRITAILAAYRKYCATSSSAVSALSAATGTRTGASQLPKAWDSISTLHLL